MNLPIDPKKVAAEALASGALRVGDLKTYESALGEAIDEALIHPKLRTPQEAGIAPIPPAPKADGRTKAVRRNKPHPSGNKKYVISKAQFKAERPHLYL